MFHDHAAVLCIEFNKPRLAASGFTGDRVEPVPPKGSSTTARLLLLFRTARPINSTGFAVGCRSLTLAYPKTKVPLVAIAAPEIVKW